MSHEAKTNKILDKSKQISSVNMVNLKLISTIMDQEKNKLIFFANPLKILRLKSKLY